MNNKCAHIKFLYSNQPLIKVKGQYFTQMKNFIDFLSILNVKDDSYRLIVPCMTLEAPPVDHVRINIPGSIIEVGYYSGHVKALIMSLLNALKVRRIVLFELKQGKNIMVAGPGPNSFLFWLSLMLPSKVIYAFFVRGDTLKTVKHIYKGKFVYFFAVGAVKAFRNRIISLVKSRRALVFLYGEKLKEQYKGDDSLIHVIYPLIDSAIIKEHVSLKLIENETFKILYIGRMSEEKNILNLIEACVLANERNIAFYLTIVGHGPLEQSIRSKVKTTGIKDLVNVIGYLPHGDKLFEQLKNHDLLCLPSRTEGVPRVIVESLALGLPVLCTPVGSIPDTFDGQVAYIHGFDADKILEGIEWCRQNRIELDALCKAGSQKINRFSLEDNAQKVDSVINDFLTEHT